MVPITIVNGVYKPSYNYGAPPCMCIYIVFFDLPAEITWRTHIRKSETYSFDSILQEGGCVPVLDCNLFTIILA